VAEARRTHAELLTNYADNTSGAISAERLRDFVQSVRPHTASEAPGASDDETSGFDVGHAWLDTTGPTLYECVDASEGAAEWVQVHPASGASVEWGDITGTLADQTDLDTALTGKAATSHTHVLADVTDAGTAAAEDASAFATAAQGATADAALPASSPRAPPTPVGQANGRMLAVDTDALVYVDAPAGDGDVVGPASAVDGNLAVFDGASGKLLADGGVAPASFATAAQGGLADSAVQPADDAATLGSGSATTGHVLTADGGGGAAFAAIPSTGGGVALAEGIVVVKHGSDPDVARPGAASVYWQGSVAPNGRTLGDTWLDTPAYD
jgi:hypothetical protein